MKKVGLNKRLTCAIISFFFLFASIFPNPSLAQTILNLPTPGSVVTTTAVFAPAMIKGINLYPDNPLKFDFIIDQGDTVFTDAEFKAESTKLIKYFLASLTVPENEMWVNLSPYEKNRIVPQTFGQTEMGRDLLAQDYLLKQLTASLIYPEEKIGKEFWDKIYSKVQAKIGDVEIPVNTFNKVWIVPERAEVFVNDNKVFVLDSYLKVYLEEDYVALQNNSLKNVDVDENLPALTKQTLREVIIPVIEQEINEGKTFANLRQIFNSMILATWYKQKLNKSALGQFYIDQNKIKGVDLKDLTINNKIYEQYLAAFKMGVYDYIKEDYNPVSQEVTSRRYFSGGVKAEISKALTVSDPGQLKGKEGAFAKFRKGIKALVLTGVVLTTLQASAPSVNAAETIAPQAAKSASGMIIPNQQSQQSFFTKEIHEKTTKLTDSNPIVRLKTIEDLNNPNYAESDDAINPLSELFKTEANPAIRLAILKTLQTLGLENPLAITTSLKGLDDVNEDVQAQALRTLGEIIEEATPDIIQSLKQYSEKNGLNYTLLETLGKIGKGHDEAVDILIKGMNGTNKDLYEISAKGLVTIGDKNLKAITALAEGYRDKKISNYGEIIDLFLLLNSGEGDNTKIVKALSDTYQNNDDDYVQSEHALELLARFGAGQKSALDTLISGLTFKNRFESYQEKVRDTAANGLARFDYKTLDKTSVITALFESAINDTNSAAQNALIILGKNNAKLINDLRNIAKNGTDYNRDIAEGLLTELAPPVVKNEDISQIPTPDLQVINDLNEVLTDHLMKGRFQIYAYKGMLVYDFNHGEQKTLDRVSDFFEDKYRKGKILTPQQRQIEEKGFGSLDGHDHPIEHFPRFFNEVLSKGERLTEGEQYFLQSLQKLGFLDYKAGIGYSVTPKGKGKVIISLSREDDPGIRARVLSHEKVHGLYFTNKEFKAAADQSFDQLSDGEKDFVLTLLNFFGYDITNPELVRTEYAAYFYDLESLKQLLNDRYFYHRGGTGLDDPRQRTLWERISKIFKDDGYMPGVDYKDTRKLRLSEEAFRFVRSQANHLGSMVQQAIAGQPITTNQTSDIPITENQEILTPADENERIIGNYPPEQGIGIFMTYVETLIYQMKFGELKDRILNETHGKLQESQIKANALEALEHISVNPEISVEVQFVGNQIVVIEVDQNGKKVVSEKRLNRILEKADKRARYSWKERPLTMTVITGENGKDVQTYDPAPNFEKDLKKEHWKNYQAAKAKIAAANPVNQMLTVPRLTEIKVAENRLRITDESNPTAYMSTKNPDRTYLQQKLGEPLSVPSTENPNERVFILTNEWFGWVENGLMEYHKNKDPNKIITIIQWSIFKQEFDKAVGDLSSKTRIAFLQYLKRQGALTDEEVKKIYNEQMGSGEIFDESDIQNVLKQINDKARSSDVGGIDLNPLNMNLKTGGEDIQLKFKQNSQGINFKNVEGFIPNIINVTPITNLPLLLGVATPTSEEEKSINVSFNLSFLPTEFRTDNTFKPLKQKL